MSWWKRLFGLQSTNERPAAESSPAMLLAVNATDDSEDPLLVEAKNLVALTGPKSPNELARLLKIGYSRAALLLALVESEPGIQLGTSSHHSADAAPKSEALEQRAASSVKPAKRRSSKTDASVVELPPLTGRITGNHECSFNVVGESHYQAALRRLRNGRAMSTDNDFIADIVTEPDNPHDENACAVYIEGFKVGYLPRHAATDFVRQVEDMGVHGLCRFQTKAKLAGGWGDRPMVGVLLSLPKT